MMSALMFTGFQAPNPVATAVILLGMAICLIACLPGKWKLAGSVALVAVVVMGAARLAAVEPPETNNCCTVWIAGSPWCLGWWCAYVAPVLPVL